MLDLHMVEVSRAEAKARGLARYFTWSPCLKGHSSSRLTVNGSCEACSRDRRNLDYWKNREANLKKQKERRDADPLLSQKKQDRRLARDPGLVGRLAERGRTKGLREEAQAEGRDTYFTGAPCNSGHVSPRYTKTGKCVECNKELCAKKHERRIQSDPARLAEREARREAARIAAARKAEKAKNFDILRKAGDARRKAMASGVTTYSSEWPCSKGHTGLRYTSGGGCVQCAAIATASEAKKQYDVAYVKRNKDRIYARTKEYAQRNREVIAARSREWARRNPEKRAVISKAYTHRRRAKEKAGDSTAKLFAWESSAKKVCYWCGDKCSGKYHVDHYIPLARGGLHVVSNLVIACPTCNIRKSAKDPYVFAASMGRLF